MVKDNIHTTLWIRNVKLSWWFMEFHPYVPDSSLHKRLWRLLKDKPEHKFSHKTLTYNLFCLQHVLAQWLGWICETGLSMSSLTWWSQRKWSPLPTAPQSPETRDLIAQGRTKQRWKKFSGMPSNGILLYSFSDKCLFSCNQRGFIWPPSGTNKDSYSHTLCRVRKSLNWRSPSDPVSRTRNLLEVRRKIPGVRGNWRHQEHMTHWFN